MKPDKDLEQATGSPASPRSSQQEGRFAEAALRWGGKTEEEVVRVRAVDVADEQVERLFAPQYQTTASPVHRAVWDRVVPLELFEPPDLSTPHPCEPFMEACVQVVRRRFESGSLYDDQGKISEETLTELADHRFWGMLIPPEYGGLGAPLPRFVRFLTRIACFEPMISGLASVHQCIGAVDPLRTFGTAQQKERFLPVLARGEKLSAFALTEPCAGSDLTALRTIAEPVGDSFELTGEKLFITNALPGRIAAVVAKLEGKPMVFIVELPPEENASFRLVRYGLHALRRVYNHGLLFHRFPVPKENLLIPPIGDGLTIAYHGLNLGRISLCAGAAGVLRSMLANMLPWTDYRKTYGAKIKTRELVKWRIARLAALLAGAEALSLWGARLLDQGYRGELECMVAKIFGSEAQKEAAIELLMKTHGGRSFLVGHPFGDNIHDFLAPLIYEGEGQMLTLAFFKTLVKHHGLRFFEPLGRRLQAAGLKEFHPWNIRHLWPVRRELTRYLMWLLEQMVIWSKATPPPDIPLGLARHVDFALSLFRYFPRELSALMRRYQLKLPDRQCRVVEMSLRIQKAVTILVTAFWGARQKDPVAQAAADLLCQDLERELLGRRPTDRYFRDCVRLADSILDGQFRAIDGCPRYPILMPYDNP
jgi:alkylation response protein AidB-like acyl-CoA dehydrogenase